MSNKDYCLLLAANEPPSEGLSCPACSFGPCKYVQVPSSGNSGRKKRTSRQVRRKTFPAIRHTDSFYSQNSTVLPYYREASDVTEDEFASAVKVDVDMVNEVNEIQELNRLSASRGTQVIHNKFYVHPSLVSALGPELVFKSEGLFPTTHNWVSFPECYMASLLTNAIGHIYIDNVDIYPALFSEASAVDGYAFNAMRPAFKTGFSALNFLLELDDLSKLLPSVLGTIKSLAKAAEHFDLMMGGGLSWRKARFGHSLNQLVSAVADNHLAYQFGVLPTIGDVQAVVSVFDRIRTNVQRFKDGAAALMNVRHFKASFEPTSEYKESLRRTLSFHLGSFRFDYDCVPDGFEPMSNGTPADHVSYNATMEFTYYCKTLADMDPLVAALYTQLGIKPDASIIWNAIPFSFVLDWFVDIGAFLDKYASVDLITSEVTIHQWWRGLKSRPRWKCVPVNMTCNATGVEKPVIGTAPVITVYGQSYTRTLHNVDVEKLVDINSETPDGLTLKRGLLSASLLKKLVFH